MHCYTARQAFSEYYDGGLEPKLLRRLEVHLCACDDCRAGYGQFERALGALGELEPEDVLLIEAETDVDEVIGEGGVPPFELASKTPRRLPATTAAGGDGVARSFASGRQPLVSRIADGLRSLEERRPYAGVVAAAAAAFFALGLGLGLGVGIGNSTRELAEAPTPKASADRSETRPGESTSTPIDLAHDDGASDAAEPIEPDGSAPDASEQPSPSAAAPDEANDGATQPTPTHEPTGTTIAKATDDATREDIEDVDTPKRSHDGITANAAPPPAPLVPGKGPEGFVSPMNDGSDAEASPAVEAIAPAPQDGQASTPADPTLSSEVDRFLGALAPMPGWRFDGIEITPIAFTGDVAATPAKSSFAGFNTWIQTREHTVPQHSRLLLAGRGGNRVLVLGGEIIMRGLPSVVSVDGLARKASSAELLVLPLSGLSSTGEVSRRRGPAPAGVMIPSRARALLLAGAPIHVVEDAVRNALSSSGTTENVVELNGLSYGRARRFIERFERHVQGLPQARGVAITIDGQLRAIDLFGSHDDLCGALRVIVKSAVVERALETRPDRTSAAVEENDVEDGFAAIRDVLEQAQELDARALPRRTAGAQRTARLGAIPTASGFVLLDQESAEHPRRVVHATLFPRLD